MTVMNATDLARNLSRVLDRLEDGGEEVGIIRRGHVAAKLFPSDPRMTASEALSDLGGLLSPSEGEAWKRDIARFDRRALPEMTP